MTNLEARAVSQPEETPESRYPVLGMDSLEAWRTTEQMRQNTMLAQIDSDPFEVKREFDNSIDASLDDYLEQQGALVDSDDYDNVRSLYRSASIDKVSDTEWYTSPSSRGELFYDRDADVPARDIFAQQISDMNEVASDEQGTADKGMAGYEEALRMNERWDALQTEVPEARKEVARLATKIGPNKEVYIEAKQRYDAKVVELGQIQFSDSREMYEQMTDEERAHFKANVTAYLFEEQSALRHATDENLQGTRRGRFIKRVGDWMNRGNRFTRFAKGIGVGTAVAAAAGATLGVGAIPTVGLIAGYRGFTTYARRDKREIAKFSDTDKTSLADTINQDQIDVLGRGHDITAMRYDKDAKEQRKARRKAVGWGVGSAAVAVVSGAFGHYIADGIHHVAGGFAHGVVDHTDVKVPHYHTGGGVGNAYAGPHHLPGMEPHTGDIWSHDMTGGGATHAHSALDYFSGHDGTTEFSAGGTHNFEGWINGANGTGYTVQPGDTIWGLSQKYLEAHGVKHPSVYQTDAVKDQMLKAFQAKGFADHRGWLTAGAKVKF